MDINTILDSIDSNVKSNCPNDSCDFVGDDGLLYCGKCLTVKQCRITVPMTDQKRIVNCICKCEKEKREQQEKKEKETIRKQNIENNRKAGIKDIKILQYTFDNDLDADSDESIKLKNYCKNYEKIYENNIGLLLYGDCGVGKSFYAGCIANALIDKGQSVLCTTIPKILNGLFSAEDKNNYINEIVSYQFLVLDDLGTERGTDYALEQLFTVVDERYKSNKPVIITTNLQPKDLVSNPKLEYRRIYERILEMCQPVKIAGKERRKLSSVNKSKMLNDIFKEN